jgi:post-segregation antitoxin (ccd killing protein)
MNPQLYYNKTAPRQETTMGTTVTRTDGWTYSPTSLEIRSDLKKLAKEQKINLTATLNTAVESKLRDLGVIG